MKTCHVQFVQRLYRRYLVIKVMSFPRFDVIMTSTRYVERQIIQASKCKLQLISKFRNLMICKIKNPSGTSGANGKFRPFESYCSASLGRALWCRTMTPDGLFFYPHLTPMTDFNILLVNAVHSEVTNTETSCVSSWVPMPKMDIFM